MDERQSLTAAATMVHALTTKAVDIVLAGLLLIGSVIGAQVGARFAARATTTTSRLGQLCAGTPGG